MTDRGSTRARPSTSAASRRSASPADVSGPTPASRTPDRAAAAARAFAIAAARMLGDDKCQDVVVLDVRKLSHVTEFIVIASGTSDRQMRGSLKNIEDLGAPSGFKVFRSSSDDRASWLLADFVDVIVHVFEPNTRAHYDLEMLWGDAPRLDWQRPLEGAKPRRRSTGDA